MTTRYRLPEILGGAECVFHSKGYQDGCWIVELVDTVPGMRLELESTALVAVAPPLPPQPPLWATVVVGEHQIFQHQPRGSVSGYSVPGHPEDYTWAEVCSGGTPVPLVPAPEPVELPWSAPYRDGVIGIEVFIKDAAPDCEGGTARVGVLGKDIGITWAEAREMARALWTAADAAEARS